MRMRISCVRMSLQRAPCAHLTDWRMRSQALSGLFANNHGACAMSDEGWDQVGSLEKRKRVALLVHNT